MSFGGHNPVPSHTTISEEGYNEEPKVFLSQGTRVKARSLSPTVEDRVGTWERRSAQWKMFRLGPHWHKSSQPLTFTEAKSGGGRLAGIVYLIEFFIVLFLSTPLEVA